jgi:hypothetical protein
MVKRKKHPFGRDPEREARARAQQELKDAISAKIARHERRVLRADRPSLSAPNGTQPDVVIQRVRLQAARDASMRPGAMTRWTSGRVRTEPQPVPPIASRPPAKRTTGQRPARPAKRKGPRPPAAKRISFEGVRVFSTTRGQFLIRRGERTYEMFRAGHDQRTFVGPPQSVLGVRNRHGYLEIALPTTPAGFAWDNLGKSLGGGQLPPEGLRVVDKSDLMERDSIAPGTQQLDWTILPQRWWETRRANHPHGLSMPAPRGSPPRRMAPDRFRFIDSLGPDGWYAGSHLGSVVYYVALFPRIAVADCIDEGNALYYVAVDERGDWRSILRLSKAEALRAGASRLIHRGSWQARLGKLVAPR